MQQGQAGSDATGTRDETYDVISIVYHALQGAENCEIYAEDAEDGELQQFFQRAAEQQRQLADQGKQLLAQCLHKESGGGSAFGFGEGQGQSTGSGQSQQSMAGESGGSAGGSFSGSNI